MSSFIRTSGKKQRKNFDLTGCKLGGRIWVCFYRWQAPSVSEKGHFVVIDGELMVVWTFRFLILKTSRRNTSCPGGHPAGNPHIRF